MLILPKALNRTILDAITDATNGVIKSTHVDVKLFSNDVQPSPTSVVGDFVESDFDGYLAKANIEFNAAVFDDNDEGIANATETAEFVCTGDTTPETVYGYYLQANGGGAYLGGERFDTPQQMAEAGDAVAFTPRLGYPTMAGAVQEA